MRVSMAQYEAMLARKKPSGQEYLVVQRHAEQEQTQQVVPQARIVGLDVALRCTGWGIVDMRSMPFKLAAVDCGVIKNPPKVRVSECLKQLSDGVKNIVEQYRPDVAILEGGFYGENVRTAVILGAARGAVIATLATAGIPAYEYAPRRVKQAVCGFGNASKQQVARLVAQFLAIKVDALPLDSTDALAMAICHAQTITRAGLLEPPEQL